MTVIAAILAAGLVAVVWCFLRHIRQLEQAHTTERRELMTRIQHPEIVPQDTPPTFPTPEPEVDLSALVGTINYDEDGD